MRDFKTLNIWQDGMNLVKEIYLIVEHLPTNEKYGLRNQMCRSAVSIPSNIAEGCSRNSQKDFFRFLEIALGSAFELETQFLLLGNLKYLNTEEYKEFLFALRKLQKQVNSLMQKLKANN